MLKKCALIGLVLIFIGSFVLSRALEDKRMQQRQIALYKTKLVYDLDDYFRQYNQWLAKPPDSRGLLPWGLDKNGRPQNQTRLKQQQHERLRADIDKLLIREMDDCPFADILYGENWRRELEKYRTQKEERELILTASIACTSIGAIVFLWALLIWMVRLIIIGLHRLRILVIRNFRYLRGKIAQWHAKRRGEVQLKQPGNKDQTDKYSEVLASSGWQNFEPALKSKRKSREKSKSHCGPDDDQGQSQKAIALSKRTRWYLKDKDDKDQKCSSGDLAGETEDFAVVVSAESADDSAGESKPATEKKNEKKDKSGCSVKDTKPAGFSKLRDYSLKREDISVTRSLHKTEIGDSKPLENSLAELTRQVSAIREYASSQQDRVNKLQDGYDWNIIRNFCLRIIRCIDNLDGRIARLAQQDIDTTDIEEVRDELVFALESSGVEQFEPQIQSDYNGQEKFAEVVKEKQNSDNPALAGKIAEVIRPGYQYLIDEENAKVVRSAQVKLFSQLCS